MKMEQKDAEGAEKGKDFGGKSGLGEMLAKK